MIGIRLEPVDTLFFRDGTPFSAGSAPQDDVGSLFPPSPASLAGAVRAALALCNGWSGRGRWSEEIGDVLGDGPRDPGSLSLEGPFLLRGGQPLFQMPRHVLGSVGDEGWKPCGLLRPGTEVTCDLGDAARLPVATGVGREIEGLKPGDGRWLTSAGMEAVLRGQLPPRTDVVSNDALWREEQRIGLERERSTRTAKEGKLYSTRHVRLMPDVSLGMRVAGVPEHWTLPFGRLVSLGGESRLAECHRWEADSALDLPLSALDVRKRMAVIALSPLDLEEAIYPGQWLAKPLDNVRIISACLNRPQRIGGWDSLARRPLPLRSVLPPGSVLFCEADEPRRFAEAVTVGDGRSRTGARQRWGFGLVALGVWPDESEVIS